MKKTAKTGHVLIPTMEQMVKIGNQMINQAIDDYWANSPWRSMARICNPSAGGRPGTGD